MSENNERISRNYQTENIFFTRQTGTHSTVIHTMHRITHTVFSLCSNGFIDWKTYYTRGIKKERLHHMPIEPNEQRVILDGGDAVCKNHQFSNDKHTFAPLEFQI